MTWCRVAKGHRPDRDADCWSTDDRVMFRRWASGVEKCACPGSDGPRGAADSFVGFYTLSPRSTFGYRPPASPAAMRGSGLDRIEAGAGRRRGTLFGAGSVPKPVRYRSIVLFQRLFHSDRSALIRSQSRVTAFFMLFWNSASFSVASGVDALALGLDGMMLPAASALD